MKELKYYGIHACQALWKVRPRDIIRVYLDESNVKEFGPLLKWCAKEKKAYHIVSSAELQKITDSVHHEGICILAKELLPITEREFFQSLNREKECLLYLDGVQNPHNLGSILRTSAHFGIRYILGEKLPALSGAACRVAKGGAEVVRLVLLAQPGETLQRLKQAGFSFIGTSSHRGESLYQFSFPPRSVLVIGSESKGVTQSGCKHWVQIPGTSAVESLNVAVATGLCIGEYCRKYK